MSEELTGLVRSDRISLPASKSIVTHEQQLYKAQYFNLYCIIGALAFVLVSFSGYVC